MPVFDLTGKIAIVTGSGQGIGRGIALGFADAGADVVVLDKTGARENTADEVRARGRRALALDTDVRDAGQVAQMVEKTLTEFGRIDILVNNVGGNFSTSFLEISEKGWEAIISQNLKTVFLCTQAVGRVMVDRKQGAIVNIASLAGIMPENLGPAYSAAKAGVINLTRYLAAEWGPYNVRVNAIAPGFIMTEGVAEMLKGQPQRTEKRRRRIPLNKFGSPQDIAAAAIYLASDASGFVTGHTLVADGGVSAVLPELT